MLNVKKVVVFVVVLACLVGLAFPLVKAADHIETIRQVIEIVQSDYYREVDPLTLVKGALKGIMEAVNDPHSNYMPPAEYDSFWERATGEYVGIGITYEMVETGLKVVQVVKGSPAEREGIRVNDIILTANGVTLADKDTADIRSILQSEDEPVALTLQRSSEHIDISVQAERIISPSAEWEMLEDNVAYIKILQFGEHLAQDISEAMTELSDARGIMLDLRNCPGGLLESAIDVAKYFVPAGPFVVLQSRGGEKETLTSPGPGVEKPLVVLVNGLTASAAEILAASIQDTRSGTIVGNRTYGKGVAQSVYNLNKTVGGIKITSMKFLSPTGRDYDGTGLQPDIWADPFSLKSPPSLAEPVSEAHILRQGQSSTEVHNLQTALRVLGHFDHVSTGYFGTITQNAVRSFQRSVGIGTTGIADIATLQSLNRQLQPPPIISDGILKRGLEELTKQQ